MHPRDFKNKLSLHFSRSRQMNWKKKQILAEIQVLWTNYLEECLETHTKQKGGDKQDD